MEPLGTGAIRTLTVSSPFLHLKTWEEVLLSKKVVYAFFGGATKPTHYL